MGALAHNLIDEQTGELIPQTWATRVRIVQPNVQPVSVIRFRIHPTGAPQTFSLALSGNIGAGLGPPLYNVHIGIGDSNYDWFALPAPAPGAAYIVLAHSVFVEVYPAIAAAGTEVFCSAAPSEAAPTLTP